MAGELRTGDPVAYLTATKPNSTLEFQCFYCRKKMTKKASFTRDNGLTLELKCPDHEAVTVTVIY